MPSGLDPKAFPFTISHTPTGQGKRSLSTPRPLCYTAPGLEKNLHCQTKGPTEIMLKVLRDQLSKDCNKYFYKSGIFQSFAFKKLERLIDH